MKKKIAGHIGMVFLILLLCLGLPIICSEKFPTWAEGGRADSVSSASVVLEKPSGECTVLINRALHTDKKNLTVWQDFFEGKEVPVIFEDITCAVPKTDVMGLEMAKSFQSRLPEHQMEIESEDAILLLSKAEYGKFDVLLLSEEFAKAYRAENLYANKQYQVIRVKKKEVSS